jgi:hypothetical protein
MPVSVDGSDNDDNDSEGSGSRDEEEASNALSAVEGVVVREGKRVAEAEEEAAATASASSSSSSDDGSSDDDSDDQEDEEDVEDFEDVYENCDKEGTFDEEDGRYHDVGASRSSSFSTDSSSSASASSSSVEAAGGSFKRLKGCGSTTSCCRRRRCLLLLASVLVLLAIPLGMVYRFYLSRHPNGTGSTVGSKKQASTYATFPSSEPTYPSFPTFAPSLFDDGSATVSDSPSPLPSTSYPHSSNPIASNTPTRTNTGSPSVAPTATATATNETLMCNGLANLCTKRANEVLFATLHNGHAAYDSGFTLFPNHGKSLEDAVEAGFRGVNVDVGRCDNAVQLTHSYCFLGTRDPVEVFRNLDAWLDANPREVLLMPTQIDNEAGGPVSLEEVWDTLKAAGNFVDKLYVRDTASQAEYPTLQELIDRNQRVLFFIYNGEQSCADLQSDAGATSSGGFQCPGGLYDWFVGPGAAAETQYSFETLEAVEDASQSCQVTRGDVTQASFLGVNVFLSIPSRVASSYLNSADFLEGHLEDCAAQNARQGASAVLVDFWEEGDVLEVVQRYNEKL